MLSMSISMSTIQQMAGRSLGLVNRRLQQASIRRPENQRKRRDQHCKECAGAASTDVRKRFHVGRSDMNFRLRKSQSCLLICIKCRPDSRSTRSCNRHCVGPVVRVVPAVLEEIMAKFMGQDALAAKHRSVRWQTLISAPIKALRRAKFIDLKRCIHARTALENRQNLGQKRRSRKHHGQAVDPLEPYWLP